MKNLKKAVSCVLEDAHARAAVQSSDGWNVDWGFLVLSDGKLLGVDGAHKLYKSQWAALASPREVALSP